MEPNAPRPPEALPRDLEAEPVAAEEDDGTLRGAPDRRRMPEPPPRFDVLGRLFRNLVYTSVLAVVPATVALLVTLGLWVASGVPAIQSARGALLSAEARYHDALHHTQPVIAELEQHGAPADQIQVVYFAFADARNDDEARRLADTYLGVLGDQVKEARRRHDATRLEELLGPADVARRRTAVAYADWTDHLRGPRGRLALALGLVAPPSPGMAVYERPHPR